MDPSSSAKNIIIIGGGIIGCTTAYYITHHPLFITNSDPSRPNTVTILEATSIASGASGKAGGLVARWAYPAELTAISVEEHIRLAKEYGGAERWGWREVECGEWRGSGRRDPETPISEGKKNSSKAPPDLDWVHSSSTPAQYEPMATPGSGDTMQVHPYQFTTSILELAKQKGARVIYGAATRVLYADDGTRVTGVEYLETTDGEKEPKILKATDVIVSAGPWSSSSHFSLLPTPIPLTPVRAHSITVRPSRPVSAYTLFTSVQLPALPRKGQKAQGGVRIVDPEIYARPNNEVYISTGEAPPVPFPSSTAAVEVDDAVCDDLYQQVCSISDELRDGELLVKQACYLPNLDVGPRGCPVIGKFDGKEGLYVATGHTCWGICNGPGTGKAISELVLEGSIKCANLKRLELRNFI